MFQLSAEEHANLKSQFVISSWGGARRALPYAFTEHGVAMLSSVLKSKRAVQMNILVIRAFVKLRELLATHKDVASRIEQIEVAQKEQARVQQQHSSILVSVIQDIQKLKTPPVTRAIGFVVRGPKKK